MARRCMSLKAREPRRASEDVVLGHEESTAIRRRGAFFGATIGRDTTQTAVAVRPVILDGTAYLLLGGHNGANMLHGGTEGLIETRRIATSAAEPEPTLSSGLHQADWVAASGTARLRVDLNRVQRARTRAHQSHSKRITRDRPTIVKPDQPQFLQSRRGALLSKPIFSVTILQPIAADHYQPPYPRPSNDGRESRAWGRRGRSDCTTCSIFGRPTYTRPNPAINDEQLAARPRPMITIFSSFWPRAGGAFNLAARL